MAQILEPSAQDRLLERVEPDRRDWDQEEREEQTERLSPDDGHGNRGALLATHSETERRRKIEPLVLPHA